jgi:hypothetical protein
MLKNYSNGYFIKISTKILKSIEIVGVWGEKIEGIFY